MIKGDRTRFISIAGFLKEGLMRLFRKGDISLFPGMPLFVVAIGALLVSGALVAAQGQGYQLSENFIEVNRPDHWNQWIVQNDVVASLNAPIDSTGLFNIDSRGVWPRYFRAKHNLAPEADQHIYKDIVRAEGFLVRGGASALSNRRIAGLTIDGDLETYWEPAEEDFSLEGLRGWELLIDLGRLAFVDSITVVFSAGDGEGEFSGDPARSFVLFVSMGERFPPPSGTSLAFTVVGKATNLDLVDRDGSGRYLQRTFPLEPLDRADFDLDGQPDMTGSFIHYAKLKIMDSAFDRKKFIGVGEEGREAYETLPPERRGAVVYQRITAGGALVEVDESIFQKLDARKRGPIRYYAREVPRVLEVEVWGRGDNVVQHPDKRGGGAYGGGGLSEPTMAIDGLYNTEWAARAGAAFTDRRGTMWVDLGAAFWINSLLAVMANRADNWNSTRGAFGIHDFRVSDGTQINPLYLENVDDFGQLEDGLQWQSVVSEDQIDNLTAGVRMLEERFPLRKVRFLQIRNPTPSGADWGPQGLLGELQLYGVGYPPDLWLYSPPIELTDASGGLVRLTMPHITWEAEAVVHAAGASGNQVVERSEPLELHPEVRLQLQTRTSDQTDTTYTYFEVVDTGGEIINQEIVQEAYDDLVFRWERWNAWEALDPPHQSRFDDDGDGREDEDPIDFIDNDGDGLVDEDDKKLGRGNRPRSLPDRDGELALVGWSEWSRSYEGRGEVFRDQITSPNPRRFLQVRVRFFSEDPEKAARLSWLRVELARPLALELAGELAVLEEQGLERSLRDLEVEGGDYRPPVGVDPLREQVYSYFIRASGSELFSMEGGGFDELLIVGREAVELRGVRVGEVRVTEETALLDPAATVTRPLESRFTRSFQDVGDGAFRDMEGIELEILSGSESDSLHMRFPFELNGGLSLSRHALVEVQLSTQVFEEGVELKSFVGSSREEGRFQRVETEQRDATELIDSNTARPSVGFPSSRLIQAVQIMPVLTPNGDGVNDRLIGSFVLLRVLEERPVEVDFFDLAGKRMGRARIEEGADTGTSMEKVGELHFSWDGRSASGGLAPPGTYLCRIRVKADRGMEELLQPIHLVY
jgi:hypothetical protein